MTQRVYAGIDIGATNIKFGLVDDSGEIQYRDLVATPQESSADKLFEKVQYAGEQLLIEADDRDAEVEYVGVGSPGSVNIESGIIQGSCPNIPHWVGFHLRDRLSEQLNLQVHIDNDANCAALAEHRFGAGAGYRHIICLTIGTGIGGGMIIDGGLYHGADFSAGEVGHMLIDDPSGGGEPVFLETVVSAPAIIEEVRRRLNGTIPPVYEGLVGNDLSQLTIRKIYAAVKKNDSISADVLRDKAELLGVSLAGLANVVNPELIILGGGVAEGGAIFVDTVKETIGKRALRVVAGSLKVVPAKMGNAAGFIGAAMLGANDGERDRK